MLCSKLWGLIGGILITVKREVLVAGGFLCCPHIISGGLVIEQVIIYINGNRNKM